MRKIFSILLFTLALLSFSNASAEEKHMIYLTAWFLCMGFILLSNFSWIALGILVVLSVVSLYKNVFGVDGKIFQYTTLNIRYYILISVLFIECIYIIKNWNGFDSTNYTYSYTGQKLYVMEPDQNTIIEANRKIKNAMEANN